MRRRNRKQKRANRQSCDLEKYPLRPTVHRVISMPGLVPTNCTTRQRLTHKRLCGCRCGLFGVQQLRCTACHDLKLTFNACNDRHCPRCDDGPRDAWRERIGRVVLGGPHLHIVYTLPHESNALHDCDEHNQRQMSALIIECAQLTNARSSPRCRNTKPGS